MIVKWLLDVSKAFITICKKVRTLFSIESIDQRRGEIHRAKIDYSDSIARIDERGELEQGLMSLLVDNLVF